MLVDQSDTQKIYGKTGSGNGKAWFVGFSESNEERKYFAIYLNDSEQREQVSGNKAKEIALEILKQVDVPVVFRKLWKHQVNLNEKLFAYKKWG